MPTKYDDEAIVEVETADKGVNAIETMMNYANAGFKGVIGITVALIVFLSVVAMINNFIGAFFPSVTLESILGVLFTPLAFLMGVPAGEVGMVSQILATKIVTNEAVAFGLPQFALLSANARAMMTTALCGFAGIGSIGILIGGYSAVAPNKVGVVGKYADRCCCGTNVIGGRFMKNFMAGLLAGLIVIILFGGIIILGGCVATITLNVFLGQLGLGTVNMFGVGCLTVALNLIYKFIRW